MGAVGLKTYIWNNALKSIVLLACFPVLILAVTYAVALIVVAMDDPSVGRGLVDAAHLLPQLVPIALAATAAWYVIAWFIHQPLIAAATGARRVSRQEEPRLYNLVENLAISRGLPVPAVRIVETDALNAYASGIRKGNYSITVTRGLLENLDDNELQAVLGHEMTHIINGDVRLLVVCTIFVGIVSLGAELLIRAFGWGGFWMPLPMGGRRSRDDRRGGGGGGGALVLILIAVAIFIVARLLALLLRLALSRRREFMADAGSVELTKNPDAMIMALRKIEGRSTIPRVPGEVREMFFDNALRSGIEGLFATHPPVEARVAALVRYAGGHDPGPLALPPPGAAQLPGGVLPQRRGPWAQQRGPWARPRRGPWGGQEDSDRRGPWG
jgi:heat shock protein HtpX